MDPIAGLLGSVRLVAGIFVDARFTAPWSVTAAIDAEDCRPWLADPRHIIGYHVVLAGEAIVGIPGGPSMRVSAGEIVLFPQNHGHTLASHPGLAPVRAGTLLRADPAAGLARIEHGGGGAATHLVCGFLASTAPASALVAALPPMLRLDLRAGTARDWVAASVRFAAAELAAGRLPSAGLVPALSETLLAEAIRHWAGTAAAGGRPAAIADPQIARALALIHADLRRDWPVARLAREAGMSRSAFVARFTAQLGQPPIRYQTALRLAAARRQLCDGAGSIAQVAWSVGYDSEEAFSRAFKRAFEVSPGRFRERAAA